MGTNYYLQTEACSCCGRSDGPKHIGKSSAGWVFALRIYPEDGINNLTDWLKVLCKDDAIIKNEYGDPVSFGEMVDVIVNRSHPKGLNNLGPNTDGTYTYNNYEFC